MSGTDAAEDKKMTRIANAQTADLLARAAKLTIQDEIERLAPSVAADATEAEFDAWNERVGDLEIALGYDEALTVAIAAENELLSAVRETLSTPEADIAYAVALGKRASFGHVKARADLLDLCRRLDTQAAA